MKQMKRISLTTVLLLMVLGTFTTIFAQGQRPPRGQDRTERPQMDAEEIVKGQMKWFTTNFDLTEDQIKIIEEIHQSDSENRKIIMESGLSPRDSEFREKMEGINIKKEAELEEILTKEQWKVFVEKKEEYQKIGRPERPQRQGRNG